MAQSCCESEIQVLKEELNDLEQQVKRLKNEYNNLLVENLQKDVIIRQKKLLIAQNKYAKFNNNFSKEILGQLNSFGNSQREDSTFVATAIKGLYNGDIETIKHKSLSGRSKKGETGGISPEKKKILESLYDERMSFISGIDETRKNNLNKLIRNAIRNANRKND